VRRVVIGTRACESLPFVRAVVEKFGAERIAVGIDAKDGIVSTKGWTAPSPWTAPDLARAVAEQGVRTIIYTDIATDGMFTGPNLKALRELSAAVPEVDSSLPAASPRSSTSSPFATWAEGSRA
jgi:phosphoribosylformimino-5-aminoimidazole carboxamide ribotide isomerase